MTEVVVLKGKIYIRTNDAMTLMGVSKQTLSGWKKKDLIDYSENEIFQNGKKVGRCFEATELMLFEQTKISKKFSNKTDDKKNETIDYERVPLANGMFLSQIDIRNPEHIELAIQHPFGEMYLEGMKSSIVIEEKKHGVDVKKGAYIYTYELDDILSEFMGIATNSLASLRDITPIQQIDKLISMGIVKKEDKTLAKEMLSSESDKIFNELFKDIDKSFFKGIAGEPEENDEDEIRQGKIKLLEDMIQRLKEEDAD